MTTSYPSLIPANDAERLLALDRYQLLDASREKILDDVVATTAQLFGVSNATLTLVEENQVLLKGAYNLPAAVERVPRNQSLCSATILQNDTAVFEDLTQIGAPNVDIVLIMQMGIHFYAGHNLRTPDGHNIGTLCIFDGAPRRFAPAERHLLAQLAGLMMNLLELRRILGPHTGLTAMLWGPIYRAMSEQLAGLSALATDETAPRGRVRLTPEATQQAGAIVARLDQFVAGTLRRI